MLEEQVIIDGCAFASKNFPGNNKLLNNSNIDIFFFTVPNSNEGFKEACKGIINIYNNSDKNSHILPRTYKEIKNSIGKSKIIIIPAFQDPIPIENNIDLLKIFFKLGVRIIQLTYNKANYIGSGCVEFTDSGLTDFGKEVVKEMNKLGIIIDLSHSSFKTTIDSIKLSKDPVIFSHANAQKITSNPRNKTDKEIKLMAEKGGVIGVTPWGPLCMKKGDQNKPTIEDYLDHVDYIVELVGIDHVGFGSDNTIDNNKDIEGTKEQAELYPEIVSDYNIRVPDPEERHVDGFTNIAELPNVILGMQKRGYMDEEISKFLGGNFLRVIKQVWK